MSLDATVQRLRNYDSDRKALAQDRDAFLTKWRADVEAVYAQFEQALQHYIKDGTAVVTPAMTELTEEALGSYEIPMRIIDVVGRTIHLMPKARIVPGGTGRIDLFRVNRPSEGNRIILSRGIADVNHNPDTWLVLDRRKEKNTFEKVLTGSFVLTPERPVYRSLDAAAILDSIDYVLNV